MNGMDGWLWWVLAVLAALDLVALVRPRIVVGWLQQWLAWSNRISRLIGLERRIVDETRCAAAVCVGAVLYAGLLLAIAVLLVRGP